MACKLTSSRMANQFTNLGQIWFLEKASSDDKTVNCSWEEKPSYFYPAGNQTPYLSFTVVHRFQIPPPLSTLPQHRRNYYPQAALPSPPLHSLPSNLPQNENLQAYFILSLETGCGKAFE